SANIDGQLKTNFRSENIFLSFCLHGHIISLEFPRLLVLHGWPLISSSALRNYSARLSALRSLLLEPWRFLRRRWSASSVLPTGSFPASATLSSATTFITTAHQYRRIDAHFFQFLGNLNLRKDFHLLQLDRFLETLLHLLFGIWYVHLGQSCFPTDRCAAPFQ